MSKQPFFIKRMTLIGVGLIGGSLVQALREQQAVGHVTGVGRNPENLVLAKQLGVIDEFSHNITQASQDSDLIVIATPVLSVDKVLDQVAASASDQAIITDVSSVKGPIVQQARNRLGARFSRFVPGHPIAGAEKSGVQAAFPSLFDAHKVILTPTDETDTDAVNTIKAMWIATGAEVESMQVDEHDKILATTSHLPHVLAYALMGFLDKQPDKDTYFRLAAGGLYDFTRIASSDPVMWRDICLSNQAQLSEQVRALASDLESYADLIDQQQGEQLHDNFAAAKGARARVADFRK